jgi:DNA-binding transcriptional MerR regulator
MTTASGAHLSIGEVLALLQEDFPDVTISKIRFLESQGLIDPERTPSGYRKFYEADIARLRWILTQQRENFLPLKVIKDRLGEGDLGPDTDENGAGPGGSSTPVLGEDGREEPVPIWMADVPASGRDTAAEIEAAVPRRRRAPARVEDVADVSLNAKELAAASGLEPVTVTELERFGLIVGKTMGNDTYYDGDALVVAQKAAAFLGHGIEPRHLRMYKISAEREAGFFEQVVMPLLKQRNPEARKQAIELLGTLTELGDDLRATLLRSNLRDHLTP